MENKLVSIILPTYNGSRYIKEALDSIFNQTYKNWELIIVNDCSVDNTLDVINEYVQNDARVKVISNKTNQKTPKSLNNGFALAKGEYYTWISDDNRFKPYAIEYMVNYLNNNKSVDFISCAYENIDDTGNPTGIPAEHYYGKCRNTLQLLYRCNIGACFMYRKSLADKTGMYDEDILLANDYDYWMRAAACGNIAYDDTILYEYRRHGASLTSTKNSELWEETRKVIEKNVLPLSLGLKMSKWEKVNLLLDLYEEKEQEIYLNAAGKVAPVFFKTAKIIRRLFRHKICKRNRAICVFGIKFKIKRKHY